MKVVFPKQDGNWNDAIIWQYWDEDLNQAVDYNQVPADGDAIYLDGHIITLVANLLATLNYPNSVISNEENPYTHNSGGYINSGYSAFTYFFAKKWNVGDNYLLYRPINNSMVYGDWFLNGSCTQGAIYNDGSNVNTTTTINGNIYCNNPLASFRNNMRSLSGIASLTINGNVQSNITTNAPFSLTNTLIININGNFKWNGLISDFKINNNNNGLILSVNGNLILKDAGISHPIRSALVAGDLYLDNSILCGENEYVRTSVLQLDGNLYYCNVVTPICFTSVIFSNPETFVCKDLSEPRTNPFVVVTDKDMTDYQQLPHENEVLQGVVYEYGLKIGTYVPDMPQEATVLNGVTYDNGNKIGSLEVKPKGFATEQYMAEILGE